MAQHPTTHIYSTVRLAANTGTAWAGEISVFGLRIGSWPVTTAPDRSAGDVQLYEYLTNDASVTRSTSTWNVQQGWAGDSGEVVNVTDADQDSIADAWLTFLTTLQSYWPGRYHLESIRLYNIGRNGKTGSAPSIYTPITAVFGLYNQMMDPTEAIVVSTASSMRGREGRGRFYFGPLWASVKNDDGQISSGVKSDVGTAAATLVDSLEGVGGVAFDSRGLIVHRKTMTGVAGATRGAIISGIRVGNELDRQSRRRRQVPESYTTYPL